MNLEFGPALIISVWFYTAYNCLLLDFLSHPLIAASQPTFTYSHQLRLGRYLEVRQAQWGCDVILSPSSKAAISSRRSDCCCLEISCIFRTSGPAWMLATLALFHCWTSGTSYNPCDETEGNLLVIPLWTRAKSPKATASLTKTHQEVQRLLFSERQSIGRSHSWKIQKERFESCLKNAVQRKTDWCFSFPVPTYLSFQ